MSTYKGLWRTARIQSFAFFSKSFSTEGALSFRTFVKTKRFSHCHSCGVHSLCSSPRFFSSLESPTYDVVVIGGGPGGYVAAIKCAQLGLKTACVEGRGALGGTCLNVGCIPSKAILNISQKYYELQHDFEDMGIHVNNYEMNVEKMMKKKDKIVKGLTDGIEYLFRKNKVDYIQGWGSLESATSVSVKSSNTSSSSQRILNSKNIILATGSLPASFSSDILTVDEKVVLSSTGALELTKAPKKMVVIGGGVIGLELGSVWNRLGTDVEVIEYLDRLCPAIDNEIVKAFQRLLEKHGIKFHLSTKVVGADIREDGVTLHTESVNGEDKKLFNSDVVLISVGRRPNTSNLNLEKFGVELDKSGRVIVDDNYRIPNLPTVYGIGDIIKGPMLAHKAEEEAIYVSEFLSGNTTGEINYSAIPSVVYTHPELAGVGFTEDQLKEKDIKYKKGTFPFAANSRAKANNDFDGFFF